LHLPLFHNAILQVVIGQGSTEKCSRTAQCVIPPIRKAHKVASSESKENHCDMQELDP
jgi:hypothetical protein